MIVTVDTREGSKQLIPQLRELGLDVNEAILPHGDIYIATKPDENGLSIDVGIEFKKIQDLVTSLRDGRLIDTQASGMAGPQGDYDIAWLLIEGEWSTNNEGLVIEPFFRGKKKHWRVVKGRMHASEMRKRLFTLAMKGGFHVWFTHDRRATLAFLLDLVRWCQDKSFNDHQTLLTAHATQGFVPISDFRAIVKDRFPGVGLRASLAVERHFKGSLRAACNAALEEWAGIEVKTKIGLKRLGTKVAERIMDFVDGRNYAAEEDHRD
jgi:ERCC4-type nuclease